MALNEYAQSIEYRVDMGAMETGLGRQFIDDLDFFVTLLDCRQGDSLGTFTLRFLRLGRPDRTLIMQESRVVAKVIMALYQPGKLNIAALGNQVLHLQHVARFKTDPAWPRPVWGAAAATEYQLGILNHRLADLRAPQAPHGLGNP